jgi:hypothetical protein
MIDDPLSSKISGNVGNFSFYDKNMYFILFHIDGSTQRKLAGPQKGV